MGGRPPMGPMGPQRGHEAAMGPHGPQRVVRGGLQDGERPPGVRPAPAAPSPCCWSRTFLAGALFWSKNAFFAKNLNFEVEKKVEIWPIWTHHDLRRPCPVILLNFTKVKKA